MVKIVYKNALYYCLCDFMDKEIPKRAGFVWDKGTRVWYTPCPIAASKTLPHAHDADSRAAVEEGLQKAVLNIEKSNVLYSDFEVPHPVGIDYRPYQKAGIEFMRNRRSVLLGDEMGIGKTIQVIGLYNYHMEHGLKGKTPRILIVSPAIGKRNWRREWLKWSITKQSFGIADGNFWPNTEIVSINYDILIRHKEVMDKTIWDFVVLDEFHYLKNKQALRTKQIFGDFKLKIPEIKAKIKIAVSGTPIPNRPIELYAPIRYLDPLTWPNKLEYAKRYCAAMQNGYGWDMDGASNLDELQARLRASIMIRRLKKDVMKDLPDKERQVIEIEIPEGDELSRYEKRFLNIGEEITKTATQDGVLTDEQYDEVVKRMKSGAMGGFEEISKIRKMNAVAKIPAVIDHLKECIESSGKVVCFIHHTEVAEALMNAFKDCAVSVTGNTSAVKREQNVDRFQQDPECKLFVGNIIAAGTTITLTASSHVVFAELSWVPGEVSQAEDRLHRDGQKECVLVQHLVAAGSIDAVMAKTIVYKQQVLDKAQNTDVNKKLEGMLI